MAKELTAQQKLFCELYVANGFNGTKAALDAGYANGNYNSAGVRGSALLKRDNIKKYINGILEELKITSGVNEGEVIMGIKNLAYNPATPDGVKLQAFKLLGEYLQIFGKQSQVIVNNNVNVDSFEEMSTEELEQQLARLEEVEKNG